MLRPAWLMTTLYGAYVQRPDGDAGYSPSVTVMRRCSRTACGCPAVATLTYVYAESTAVLGPLATYAEPHTYDMCASHAERLTVPRGWEVVRLVTEFEDPPVAGDDLLAVVDAVREEPRSGARKSGKSRRRGDDSEPGTASERGTLPLDTPAAAKANRRGHLRVLRDT